MEIQLEQYVFFESVEMLFSFIWAREILVNTAYTGDYLILNQIFRPA